MSMLGAYGAYEWLVLVRFEKWEEMIQQVAPTEMDRFLRAIFHHTRGVALAGPGKAGAAVELSGMIDVIAKDIPAEAVAMFKQVLALAGVALGARIGREVAGDRAVAASGGVGRWVVVCGAAGLVLSDAEIARESAIAAGEARGSGMGLPEGFREESGQWAIIGGPVEEPEDTAEGRECGVCGEGVSGSVAAGGLASALSVFAVPAGLPTPFLIFYSSGWFAGTSLCGSKRCSGLNWRLDHLLPGSNWTPIKKPISR